MTVDNLTWSDCATNFSSKNNPNQISNLEMAEKEKPCLWLSWKKGEKNDLSPVHSNYLLKSGLRASGCKIS